MDLALARTFLAIAEVGSFVKAADQLYVTQSTVSARVKQLEALLGQQLFLRSKAGATLTAAGVKFRPFAEKMLQIWEQAQHEAGLPENFRAMLVIGVEFTLWQRLLVHWLPWMRNALPEVAIRAEVDNSQSLMRKLQDGIIDMAVTYTPLHRNEFTIDTLLAEELIMVSSNKKAFKPWDDGYIYVDWGAGFRAEHMETFPGYEASAIAVSYGPLALQHLLVNEGAAYLPRRIVRPMLEDGRLFEVPDMPVFSWPVYIVYADTSDEEQFAIARQGLHYIASQEDISS